MSTAVPASIVAGDTCYQHFAAGKKDLYAPDFMLPRPSPEHTWRYGVSSGDHGGTVFFNNEATRRSAWVLPAVDRATGQTRELAEGEAMRAQGKVPSARDAPPAVSTATTPTTTTIAAVATESPKLPTARSCREGYVRGLEVEEVTEEPRPQQQQQQQEERHQQNHKQQQQQEHRQERREDRELSVQERLAAYRARTGLPVYTAAAPAAVAHTAGSKGNVPVHVVPPAAAATVVPRRGIEKKDNRDEAAAHAKAPRRPSQGPDLEHFIQSLYERRGREETVAAEALRADRIAAMEEERLAVERQRRALAAAGAEEAERLRLVARRREMEQQRLTIAEGRLKDGEAVADNSSSAAGEEEGHAGAGAGSTEAVAADAMNVFLARQEAALRDVRKRQAAARSLDEAIAAALASLPTQAPAQPPSQQQRQGHDSTGTVAVRAHDGTMGGAAAQPPRIAVLSRSSIDYGDDFRYVGDISTVAGGEAGVSHHRHSSGQAPSQSSLFLRDCTNRPAPPSHEEADKGLSALLATTNGATPLPSRHGQGTLHLKQRTREPRVAEPHQGGPFFKGGWSNDRREGQGLLSLPSAVVQGEWADDALLPGSRALLQTRRMKGAATVHSAGGPGNNNPPPPPSSSRRSTEATAPRPRVTFSGPAMLELDNGARIAITGTTTNTGSATSGAASKRGSTGDPASILAHPGIVSLPSGDRVEWWPDEALEETNAPSNKSDKVQSNQEEKRARGTGKCVIRLRNGDRYTGSVAGFLMHGYGRYEFRQRGGANGNISNISSSNVYVGFFYRGLMQGEGTYTFADGDAYIGGMMRGAFHGVGRYVHRGRYVYEGEWRDGAMHGRGRLAFANGDVWTGTFAGDKRVAGKYTHFVL